MVNIGVVGAAGYTGQALLKILLSHKEASIVAITSETYANKPLAEVFPEYTNAPPLTFKENDYKSIAKRVNAVFLCLPHTESMAVAPVFLNSGVTVFDLSADFRLKKSIEYKKWYNVTHPSSHLLDKAVYGLPEFYSILLADAELIACPGCYPTSAILGLAPVIGAEWIDRSSIVINSASGVTGAGKKANVDNLFGEISGNCYAYAAPFHRHTPEIEQELSLLASEPVTVSFIPHLIPTARGIYSTITVKCENAPRQHEIVELYKNYYQTRPFVKVFDRFVQMSWANNSNNCFLGVTYDKRNETLIISSTIDNLIKGAAGQAVQCFNIRYGFPEETGL